MGFLLDLGFKEFTGYEIYLRFVGFIWGLWELFRIYAIYGIYLGLMRFLGFMGLFLGFIWVLWYMGFIGFICGYSRLFHRCKGFLVIHPSTVGTISDYPHEHFQIFLTS